MPISSHIEIGSILFAIAWSGWALADCPNTMPLQLQEDCIIYEGAGSTFPPSDCLYELVSRMAEKPEFAASVG